MKIKRGKSRVWTVVRCIIALACVGGIVYSGWKILEWKADSDNTAEQVDKIEQVADVDEVEDSEETEIVKTEEPPESMYWSYIKTNLLSVDFTELKNINGEVRGWIQVGGTNINYPFVQTSNNDYYLKHAFDKTYNSAGWVFADFRNKLDGSDRNFILYAHGRYDKTMFGSLRNALTSGWINQPENFTVRTINDGETALWQVFSVYHIPTTNDYIQTAFVTDDEFGRFVEMLRSRSAHDFQTTVSSSDHILTLSTCYNDQERVVLHAKLIKRAPRN